ncbi:hypothetical protein [Peterkaempfera sp. SMS 1(5)a]|uniref:hypothetical protein n=1 Tax=Peterkaempfera podocarpi TaxID=3232308 RepID=UPI00366B099E
MGTISAVGAGRHWDAVVVPQPLGLAVLEALDQATDHQPGPVVWDPLGRNPRLYFLIPTGSVMCEGFPGATVLSVAAFVGLPGPTTIEPPGPHWVAPPDPDDPDRLVDAELLHGLLAAVVAEPAA